MHSHRETQHSPYTPEQLFALVSDVERYPEFIPWCRAARILERGEGQFLGELMISFANISESYVSRVTLTPHSAIDVSLVRGPFKKLSNHWRFTAKPGGGTQIDFSLEFEFRSRLLETLIGALFSRATAKMVAAFSTRADALYGSRP